MSTVHCVFDKGDLIKRYRKVLIDTAAIILLGAKDSVLKDRGGGEDMKENRIKQHLGLHRSTRLQDFRCMLEALESMLNLSFPSSLSSLFPSQSFNVPPCPCFRAL